MAVIDNTGEQATVRHTDCEILVSGKVRCAVCTTYRRSLSSQVIQHSRRTIEVSLHSHTNNRYLRSPELRIKLTLLQKNRRNMQKKINHLREKVQVEADEKGMLLDEVDHDDFKKLLLSESTKEYIDIYSDIYSIYIVFYSKIPVK